MTIEIIIDGIMKYGRGTLMAKFDIKSAYRNVAIHPEDWVLLGMRWLGWYFVDMAIPFGLHSAPFIFNPIADLLKWILIHRHKVQFLYDFHTCDRPITHSVVRTWLHVLRPSQTLLCHCTLISLRAFQRGLRFLDTELTLSPFRLVHLRKNLIVSFSY